MIALGDELGADEDVDQPGLDMGDELGRFGGRPQGVAGDDRGPGLRDAPLYLVGDAFAAGAARSEEHTSELQSLMRISYAVFCLKKKKHTIRTSPRGSTQCRPTRAQTRLHQN